MFTEEEQKVSDPRLSNKAWRISHLYKIVNRQSKVVQFKPNLAQQDYIKNKHIRNVILKSRRLGFTTYSTIDMLDNTLFNRNYNSLFISYDDPSAKKVFDEIAMFAWNHFPIKDDYRVDMSNANMLKLDFGDKTSSRVEVKSSGRGGRNNQIHVSELGKISIKYPQKAKEIFSGTIPSLVAGGFLTIESTAETNQGEFHDLYWEAHERTSQQLSKPLLPHEYKAHFYNWQWDREEINFMVPTNLVQDTPNIPKEFLDYQQRHNEKAKKMPHFYKPITNQEITYWYYKFQEVNSRWSRLLQEYPTTAEEAFQSAGSKLFDSIKIEDQKQYVTNPTTEGDWCIYERPKINHTYVLGADPSEGVGGDHSALVIIDFTPIRPKVVATYKNNYIAPDLLAYEILNKGKIYNYPLAIVERNNTGHATLVRLKDIYPQEFIYKEVKMDTTTDKETERLGWNTTITTKPRMFYDISTAINEDLIEVPSESLLHEMRLYDKNSLQKTTSDPEATNHFDLLTALALAFQGKTQVEYYNSPIKVNNIHQTQNTNKDELPAFLQKKEDNLPIIGNLQTTTEKFDPYYPI